jgi:Family of unknown function (DUF6920)
VARQPSLEDLWSSAPPSDRAFDPASVAALPEPARRYLTQAIAPGTPLASAVRLGMHGEIKLKRWYPFTAEQVICWNRGFIWQANVRMGALTIRGSDRYVDGEGAMRWKLFGLVPFITASGSDITRSAAGRVNMECAWLPSVLCRDDVSWSAVDQSRISASFTERGEIAALDFNIHDNGAPTTVSMPRWGNPEGGKFRYVNFGGFLDNERNFGGYTIPTHLRVGWHFGTERFEPEGEFFRATIDSAAYR